MKSAPAAESDFMKVFLRSHPISLAHETSHHSDPPKKFQVVQVPSHSNLQVLALPHTPIFANHPKFIPALQPTVPVFSLTSIIKNHWHQKYPGKTSHLAKTQFQYHGHAQLHTISILIDKLRLPYSLDS
ncbi:hypothetical protein PCASD_00608 [Puccinia coronata f. sp. avenae]|uniref:Uncharacterized protein n=1 Tax=Puccinia coronata f. sp. avenae TaxID=200324 RepID=A0A2N5VNW6_9BASI|nr:hypothetical protein PCASD_00608 [Puccinia coronata f. sp. avenae]